MLCGDAACWALFPLPPIIVIAVNHWVCVVIRMYEVGDWDTQSLQSRKLKVIIFSWPWIMLFFLNFLADSPVAKMCSR